MCNENVGIHLSNSAEKERLNKRINELNLIISSPLELKRQHQQMMDKTYKEYKLLLQPIHTRITDALF